MFDIDMKINVQGSQTAIKEINGISAAFEKLRVTAAEAIKFIYSGKPSEAGRSSGNFHTASAESQDGFNPTPVGYHIIFGAAARAGAAVRGAGKLAGSAASGTALSKIFDAIFGGSNGSTANLLEQLNKAEVQLAKLNESHASLIDRDKSLRDTVLGYDQIDSAEAQADRSRLIEESAENIATTQQAVTLLRQELFNELSGGYLRKLDQSFRNYKLTALPLLSKIDRSTFYLYNRLRQYDPGEDGSDPQSPSIFDQSNERQSAHTGGIIGECGGGRLGSLYGVPRYHSGGLIGAREQLAILQRGEGVFTPGQMQNADRLIAALARPLIQLENELIDALSGRHLLRDRQTQLGSEAQMIEIHLVHQIAQDLLSNAMLNSGERRIQRSQFDNIVQAYEGAGTDLPFADYAQSYRNFWDQVEASGLGALQEMQNSLIQFVETGKFEFSDLTNSILRDLLRISARETITKPLANALGSAVGNLFGLNNVQQGLKGISGIFGGSDSQYSLIPGSSIGATVTTAGGQSIQIGAPHTGGIAGQIKGKRNLVVRDVIKLFNSYHSGGVVGGREELAVLQKGEGVFTPEQMQNANAAFERIRDAQQPAPINVTVMIKTGNGAPKEHRGNFSADGRGGGVVTVDIAEQIEAYIAQRLARGYGPLSMVMRRRR
ncbi:MAG: phage tail tape measure C-terminal domain-containing protein [Pseudomonadota bacterium]